MIPSESRRRHGCAYWTATTLGFEEPTSRIRVTCSWKTRSRNSCITGLQLQACGCSFEPRRARPGDVEHVQIHVRVHDSQSDHRKSAVRSLEAPPCRQLPGTETPPRPRSRRRLRLRVSGPAVRSRTALGGRGPRRAGGRLAASATPRGRAGVLDDRERDSFAFSFLCGPRGPRRCANVYPQERGTSYHGPLHARLSVTDTRSPPRGLLSARPL